MSQKFNVQGTQWHCFCLKFVRLISLHCIDSEWLRHTAVEIKKWTFSWIKIQSNISRCPAGTKSVYPRVAARISLVIRGVHAKRRKHRAWVDRLSCISSNISVILAVALPVCIAFSCANLGSFTQLEQRHPLAILSWPCTMRLQDWGTQMPVVQNHSLWLFMTLSAIFWMTKWSFMNSSSVPIVFSVPTVVMPGILQRDCRCVLELQELLFVAGRAWAMPPPALQRPWQQPLLLPPSAGNRWARGSCELAWGRGSSKSSADRLFPRPQLQSKPKLCKNIIYSLPYEQKMTLRSQDPRVSWYVDSYVSQLCLPHFWSPASPSSTSTWHPSKQEKHGPPPFLFVQWSDCTMSTWANMSSSAFLNAKYSERNISSMSTHMSYAHIHSADHPVALQDQQQSGLTFDHVYALIKKSSKVNTQKLTVTTEKKVP